MSPLKRKKLGKIRIELDKLDNSLIKIIKKRTNLVKKVLELKDKKNQIIDQKRINIILRNIKKKSVKNKIDQKITLNSFNVMLKFCNLNSGISLYKLKYNIQSFWLRGGSIPENNCHCVIERPESVSLVKPPTTIIIEMIINIIINHKDN